MNGEAKAYALDELLPNRPVADSISGLEIRLEYDPETREPKVANAETGEAVPLTLSYWFAWQAFYPETEVWKAVSIGIDMEESRHPSTSVRTRSGRSNFTFFDGSVRAIQFGHSTCLINRWAVTELWRTNAALCRQRY
ncbi:MAG: hypothetical protein O2960_08700 [Verrucomicrobia bacterium]|nr:hypothetical protein [Verrucomicrobiota bacterium]